MSPILELQNLGISIAGRKILAEASLSLEIGESIAIIGSNGQGKTSLLKTLVGILTPTSGEIKLEGKKLKEYSASDRAKLIGYAPQILTIPPTIKVSEYLAFCRYPLSTTEQDKIYILEILDLVGAREFVNRRVSSLSGGELQRINLASALVCKPKIVLLDEPTMALDIEGQESFRRYLKRLKLESISVLLVTHDLALIREGADRVVHIADSKLSLTTISTEADNSISKSDWS